MYISYFRFLFILIGFSYSFTMANKYQGAISQSCLYQYHLRSHRPPLRHYKYFHEVQPRRKPVSELGFRIIGGNRISIERVPYQVLYGLYCGGAIIAPSWVITAAHCKESENFVLAGSSFRSTTHSYPICAHFTHPLWFETPKKHSHDWDYQLLMLEVPIPVTPKSRPIAIGKLGDVEKFMTVAVSGWGHVRPKGEMVDMLHQVKLPVIPASQCRTLDTVVYQITPRMFCAGYLNGTKDSCQGDSGGPAVINNKLVGLVSFGVGCAEPMKPGVYADLLQARPWIREVTSLPL